MDALEENRASWLSNLFRDHARFIQSALRGRWSFFTLVAAGALYISILPFLRNPLHIAISIAMWIFLIFALQFIADKLFDDFHPQLSRTAIRFSAFRQAQMRGKLTNLTAKEKPDMDKPFDCNKLNEHCETLRKELLHASQNGHLDPLSMTEQDEKNIIHHVNELSNVCSKVLVYMNSMKKTREALFS